ncbi:hypothetical protein C7451_104254 [Blastomonas natatoria]|uniref:Uncharacterized protein n=1 Tax=Blastomonas natatoria TaxID=34015 RepID=A0A2V3VAH8_9SPHN|nr:hypothetical protein [Blastomonas natatoria]PXW77758.1 hypothetical protein C7451_104254 [Blastomonas natatoria]
MTQAQHRRWLKFTAIAVAIFGPIFSTGTMEAIADPARWSLDILAWPMDGEQDFAAPTTRFLAALTGGFLLGWGVMIWFLATRVHRLAPEPVRQAVLAGLLAWFVLDSCGSIASGQAVNAVFNIAVLLILVGPLWLPATDS